jgi:predicted RecB family nuclease
MDAEPAAGKRRLMRTRIPRLSKSRFMAGLQCHKRLYLELYAPDLAAETDAATQARFDAGTEVGQVARQRFPGGRLLAQDHKHHAAAEKQTRELVTDASVPALYEAAFHHDDVAVRTDILVRRRRRKFDLIEVKSTTGWKEQHVPDLAVQLYVLEGAGLQIDRTYLMHLNRDYVYVGGDYDLGALFTCADLTEQVRALQSDVATALSNMRQPLWAETPPPIATGRHCTSPYTCEFYDHCHTDQPEHPIEHLPGLREPLVTQLADLGIVDMRDIPPDLTGLTALQVRARDVLQSGNRYHDPAIAEALGKVQFPVHFLDFETFAPALPVFVGTRPYQTIPFQWSDHVLSEDGQMIHHEFLHEGSDDPRRPFAESLLEVASAGGSVVVYSSYEGTRLRELEALFPDLTPGLAQIRARLFDLLPVVRTHVYDEAFHGSFSIKAVLPALVPHLDYNDLEIGGGLLASLAYEELRKPSTPANRTAELRANLLAYCRRDTEAMLELFKRLR